MTTDDTIMGAAPQETNERMVYSVPSDTRAGRKYRVDLEANGGYSQCDCPDWASRRWPAIREGKPMGTRATCCRHVLKVRNHFLNGVLAALSKEKEGGI